MKQTRREFVRRSCCTAAALGVASSFSRFGLVNALAQAPTDFRALVCIFLMQSACRGLRPLRRLLQLRSKHGPSGI